MNGVIVDNAGFYAIMLNDEGEFTKVINRKYNIGQKLSIKKRNTAAFISAAACFVILFLSSFSGYSLYYTPDSYASVDINPSIQLTCNRFNRIIASKSFNDEGKLVLENDNIKNLPLDNGIEKLIEASKRLGYLNEQNNEVLIDLVNINDTTIEKIEKKKEKYDSININIEKSDENILQLSNELDISIGRANVLNEYTNFNGGDIYENKAALSSTSTVRIKNKIKEKESKKNEEASSVTQDTNNNSDDRGKNPNIERKTEKPDNKSDNSKAEKSDDNQKNENKAERSYDNPNNSKDEKSDDNQKNNNKTDESNNSNSNEKQTMNETKISDDNGQPVDNGEKNNNKNKKPEKTENSKNEPKSKNNKN